MDFTSAAPAVGLSIPIKNAAPRKRLVRLKAQTAHCLKRQHFYMYAVYWGEMASTGQASAQEPQSTHFAGSISYWLDPCEMASTGQVAAQAPQETQSVLILYAMTIPPFLYVASLLRLKETMSILPCMHKKAIV
jgi:hypothetical protein